MIRRFETKAQAKKHLNTKGKFGENIFKVPKKFQKGRFTKKPFAVTNEMLWIHFGF
jgi:hypothetical protein